MYRATVSTIGDYHYRRLFHQLLNW